MNPDGIANEVIRKCENLAEYNGESDDKQFEYVGEVIQNLTQFLVDALT